MEEDGATGGTPAGHGWTFSKDLSPEALEEIKGLIAANGLSHTGGAAVAPVEDAAARSAAADAAFARMVAAHPGATVIGGPPGAGDAIVPQGEDAAAAEARAAAAEAAFQEMIAEHPDAVMVAPGVYSASSRAADGSG